MSLSQLFLFLAIVMALFCVLDWVLGKVKKDWKTLPWEDREQEDRGRQTTS